MLMEQAFRPQWPELSLRSGVIPYRAGENGRLEFLLIRRHGHEWWSIPKGHLTPGCTLAQTAVEEAYEEAGVHGAMGLVPLGSFRHCKTNGEPHRPPQLVELVLFPLEVESEADLWPEMAIRERRWVGREQVPQFVAPGPLRDLLTVFDPLTPVAKIHDGLNGTMLSSCARDGTPGTE